MRIVFFVMFILYSAVVLGQQTQEDEVSYNRRLTMEALEKKDCARAQIFYDAYLRSGGRPDTNIVSRIRQCREGQSSTQPPPTTPPNRSERAVRNETPPPSTKTPKVFTSLGIKGGMNLSTIINNTTDIYFSSQMKIGYHAGILLNLRFGSQQGTFNKKGVFGLQPEILYSNQGFVVNGNAINFNYITIPLMLKLNLGKTDSKGNFNFEFGPCFSYLITVAPNWAVIGDEYDIKLSDLTKGKDIGISAGIGYETGFGLVVGARYNQGLSDMANNLQWKNSVIALSLGWKFNLKNKK